MIEGRRQNSKSKKIQHGRKLKIPIACLRKLKQKINPKKQNCSCTENCMTKEFQQKSKIHLENLKLQLKHFY